MALRFIRMGKRVNIVTGMFDASLFRQSLYQFAGIPIVSIGGRGMSRFQVFVKRAIDVVGSAVLLVCLSPLMLAIAALIKLTSPGPVLFVQERLGQKWKRVRLYKFRTMHADAEQALKADPDLYDRYVSNNYKLPKGADPRVTPFGKFLRTTSLDELPQLFNVLTGDMSLVGPRPVVPPEIRRYDDLAHLFLSVKPGLTGLWQVNGRSEIVDTARRAELDLEYVRDQSIRTDVDILVRTIPAVLKRKGAH